MGTLSLTELRALVRALRDPAFRVWIEETHATFADAIEQLRAASKDDCGCGGGCGGC